MNTNDTNTAQAKIRFQGIARIYCKGEFLFGGPCQNYEEVEIHGAPDDFVTLDEIADRAVGNWPDGYCPDCAPAAAREDFEAYKAERY